jgi:L-ascorbate metabolism protein UlaG (beta-lactamase superfamily)
MPMHLTKLGHSCFRLEAGGTTLVLDPGGFSDPTALDGADVVLITHEHPDHVVPDRLGAAAGANPDLEIWTNSGVAAQLADDQATAGLGARVHVVNPGDTFTVGPSSGGLDAGSIEVTVHGGEHAVIHPEIPLIGNVGFVLPGGIYHPGDSFTVPEVPVTTLLTPADAPWCKISETVDWIRAVAPQRAYLMHDAILSEIGLGMVERIAGGMVEADVSRLTEGERIEL